MAPPQGNDDTKRDDDIHIEHDEIRVEDDGSATADGAAGGPPRGPAEPPGPVVLDPVPTTTALSVAGPVTQPMVLRIAELPDDAYRNLWITWAYADISDQLDRVIRQGAPVRPGEPRDATWFTVARWSSATVGKSLRPEHELMSFERLIEGNRVLRALRGPIRRVVSDLHTMNEAAMPRMLAIGNRDVFREVGHAALQLVRWHAEGADPAKWPEYREGITANCDPDFMDRGELSWLRDGIECYFAASQTASREERTDLVLRGSLLLAAYEQWRLGPVITLALDPIARRLVEFEQTARGRSGTLPVAHLRRPNTVWALRHESPIVQWFCERYAAFFTHTALAWEGPFAGDEVEALFLGRPVPDCPDATAIADEELSARTLNLVRMYDLSEPGRWATNSWRRFSDRMNAVVHLFRKHQRNPHLFQDIPHADLRVMDLDLTDEHLDAMRQIGDPPFEPLFPPPMPGDPVSTQQPRERVHQAVVQGVLTTPAADAVCTLPSWRDDAKVAAGQDVFDRHRLDIAAALFTASLPYSYTSTRGSQVLVQSAQLTHGNVTRRIAETGKMLLDLMLREPTAAPLAPRTHADMAVRGVRLYHEAIRQMLTRDAGVVWDQATLGVPINQEDLLGTLVVFTAVALDALERMGVEMRREEREAYTHLWLVAGHLLGIDYSRFRRGEVTLGARECPITLSELRLVGLAVLRRQGGHSPAGVTLTSALVRMMSKQMPLPQLHGYPVAAIRALIGGENADRIEVGYDGGGFVVFGMLRALARLLAPAFESKALDATLRALTRRLYEDWIEDYAGQEPPWASMELLEGVVPTNEGLAPSFDTGEVANPPDEQGGTQP